MTDFSFVHVEWELDDNDAPEPSLEPILSGGQVPGWSSDFSSDANQQEEIQDWPLAKGILVMLILLCSF